MATRLPPVLLAVVALHTAVAPQLRLFGVAADLPVLLAIAAAIAAGPDRGAIVGFIVGLLADCFTQTPFGLSALVYSLVGYGVGLFQSTILHSSWWIPVVMASAASAGAVVLFVAIGAVVGQSQLISTRLPVVVGMVALLNALITPPVVRVARWAVPTAPVPGVLR